jgi:hypothetical protein
MFRWARRIFLLLSFLLLAESIAFWVRSYMLADFIHHQRVERSGKMLDWHHRMVTSWHGKIGLTNKHSVWALPHPELSEKEIAGIQHGWSHDRLPGIISDTFGMNRPTRFGFGAQKLGDNKNGVRVEGRIIVFPWALPTLIFGIFPCISVGRFLESRRRIRRLKALNWNGMQTRKLAA